MIHDCMGQIAGDYDSINAASGACHHVCDETYIDLAAYVDCVLDNAFCDVPNDVWQLILDLSKSGDLESDSARTSAASVLESRYFRDRKRWKYRGQPSTINFKKIGLSVLVLVSLIFAAAWIRNQLAIDSCLDRGGAWNYEQSQCQYE